MILILFFDIYIYIYICIYIHMQKRCKWPVGNRHKDGRWTLWVSFLLLPCSDHCECWPFCRSRVVSFEACCQGVLLTVHKYLYSSVIILHAGSFRVSIICRTLTWTTGSLTCVRDRSYAYGRGLGTSTVSQHNIFDWKNSHTFFLCPGWGSNLRSSDFEWRSTN